MPAPPEKRRQSCISDERRAVMCALPLLAPEVRALPVRRCLSLGGLQCYDADLKEYVHPVWCNLFALTRNTVLSLRMLPTQQS